MSARALDGAGLMARVYRERFLRRLRHKVQKKAAHFPSLLSAERARVVRTFREFDEHFTAPLHGFISADDYWSRSSSGPLLPSVRRPLLILAAEDDPFVPPAALPRAAAVHNPYLTLEISRQGGHVAFVSGPLWRPLRFAEHRVAEFLTHNLRAEA
jgi:predicted alpha/beta-fold hydrolase